MGDKNRTIYTSTLSRKFGKKKITISIITLLFMPRGKSRMRIGCLNLKPEHKLVNTTLKSIGLGKVILFQQSSMWISIVCPLDLCTSPRRLSQLHEVHEYKSWPIYAIDQQGTNNSSTKYNIAAIWYAYCLRWSLIISTSLFGITSTCSAPSSSVHALLGMRWRAARFLLSWPYPVIG